MSGDEPHEEWMCPYCDAVFARETHRALHLGQEHESRLTPDQLASYEAASEEEAEELRLFRLKALAALVAVYFGFLLLYAFAL